MLSTPDKLKTSSKISPHQEKIVLPLNTPKTLLPGPVFPLNLPLNQSSQFPISNPSQFLQSRQINLPPNNSPAEVSPSTPPTESVETQAPIQNSPESSNNLTENNLKAKLEELKKRLEEAQREIKDTKESLRQEKFDEIENNMKQKVKTGIDNLRKMAGLGIGKMKEKAEVVKQSAGKLAGEAMAGAKKSLQWLKEKGTKVAEVAKKTEELAKKPIQEQIQWAKDNPGQAALLALGTVAGLTVAAPGLVSVAGAGIVGGGTHAIAGVLGANAIGTFGSIGGLGFLGGGSSAASVISGVAIYDGAKVMAKSLGNRKEAQNSKLAQLREQIPRLNAGSETDNYLLNSTEPEQPQNVTPNKINLGYRLSNLFNRKQAGNVENSNQLKELNLNESLTITKQPEFQNKIDNNWQNLDTGSQSLNNFTQDWSNVIGNIQKNGGGDFGFKIDTLLDQTVRPKNISLQSILDNARIGKNPPKFENFKSQVSALEKNIFSSKDSEIVKSKKLQLLSNLKSQVLTFQNQHQELLQNQNTINQTQKMATVEIINSINSNNTEDPGKLQNLKDQLARNGFEVIIKYDKKQPQIEVKYTNIPLDQSSGILDKAPDLMP